MVSMGVSVIIDSVEQFFLCFSANYV
jgi:hypothetical protein